MNFLQIWDRVKKRTSLQNLTELGNFLGITQPAISKRKKEDNFPIKWAFAIAQHYGLSTDWIMTGKNPKEKRLPEEEQPLIKEIEDWTNEIIAADRKRKDWFEIEFCKAFPEFSEWKKKKEEWENSNVYKIA